MTILSKDQAWPQIYMRRWNSDSNQWEFAYEDKSVIDVVLGSLNIYARENFRKPAILFAGPSTRNKIKDIISQNSYLMTEITTKFLEGQNERASFMGMELIFTIDDGLWMA
jgi:hypothetical protein